MNARPASHGGASKRTPPPKAGDSLSKAGIEFLEGYLRTRYLARGYRLIDAGRVENGCERLALFTYLGADFPNLRNERDAAKERILQAALGYGE